MSRSHQKGGEPSQRMLRVAELIRHAIAGLLARGEINDPDLAGLVVTVPQVRMSPDLKLATVYVMPLGGLAQDVLVSILDRHKKYLRGEVAIRVNLKYAPDIRFKVDDSFANAAKIDALLQTSKVAQDLPTLEQDFSRLEQDLDEEVEDHESDGSEHEQSARGPDEGK